LLKTIGNPATTEKEWLTACEKLGDYEQTENTEKRTAFDRASGGGFSSVTALVYGGVTLSSLNNSKQSPHNKNFDSSTKSRC